MYSSKVQQNMLTDNKVKHLYVNNELTQRELSVNIMNIRKRQSSLWRNLLGYVYSKHLNTLFKDFYMTSVTYSLKR